MSLCVDKICRTCMTGSATLMAIWPAKEARTARTSEEEESSSIIRMLELFTTIDASKGDGLPENVCVACINELHRAFLFMQKSEKSDYTLRAYLNKMLPSETPTGGVKKLMTVDEERDSKDFIVFTEELPTLNATEKVDSTAEQHFFDDHIAIHCKKETIDELSIPVNANEYDTFEVMHNINVDVSIIKNEIYEDERNVSEELSQQPDSIGAKASFQCDVCKKTFLHKKCMKRHIIHKHTKDSQYKCTVCSKFFVFSSELTKHMEWHTAEKTHVCTICGKAFLLKNHLKYHMISHERKKGKFDCTECEKSFLTETELCTHFKIHTGDGDTIFKCNQCPKSFSTFLKRRRHLRHHEDFPKYKPPIKKHLCAICGKGFPASLALTTHLMRHNNLRPFKCTESGCDKTFVTKSELEIHLRNHAGIRPYACEMCGKAYTSTNSLKQHRRTHTGERPYACEFCPMRFNGLNTLKNHRRTHTGERPYKCTHPSCDRAFAQRTDCVKHMRTHTAEHPYKCTECNRTFQQSTGLKTHMKSHKTT